MYLPNDRHVPSDPSVELFWLINNFSDILTGILRECIRSGCLYKIVFSSSVNDSQEVSRFSLAWYSVWSGARGGRRFAVRAFPPSKPFVKVEGIY